MTVRTRFAPSPTGPLHIGGVRTALYAYLFAKQHNGRFILRIEDTDQNRFVKGAEEYIIEALRWTGITPDEGVGFGGAHQPYRQSERKELGIYMDYALKLIQAGHAYYAFDSSADLEKYHSNALSEGNQGWQYDSTTRNSLFNSLHLPQEETRSMIESGKPYVIRLKVEPGREIRFNDLVRGDVSFTSGVVDDKVLIKADGMPTYHLAHIVDDITMEITHAIRGEEWLPSAPAHILIYEYLGMTDKMPQYAHLPLLLKPEGNGKLSKRDGDRLGFPVFPLEWKDPVSGEISSGYREKNYYPEAFVNMLAFLGWNPGTEKEIFTMDELITAFSFDRVQKAGARFDPEKAKWFNEQWLRLQPDENLAGRFADMARLTLSLTDTDIRCSQAFALRAVNLLKDRVHFESEFLEKGIYLLQPPAEYDEKVIAKRFNPVTARFFLSLTEVLPALDEFNASSVKSLFEKTAAEAGIKTGELLQLFRVLISGQSSGVDLFGMIELFGKEETILRLKTALNKLNA